MPIKAKRIINPEAIEVHIGTSGRRRYNRLFICTGTADFNFDTDDEDNWKVDTLEFLIPDPDPESNPLGDDPPPSLFFAKEDINDAIAATASLGSISADENNVGWAVNSVDADWDIDSGRIKVTAEIAVKGEDGHFNRLGYQVNFLARRTDGSPSGGPSGQK